MKKFSLMLAFLAMFSSQSIFAQGDIDADDEAIEGVLDGGDHEGPKGGKGGKDKTPPSPEKHAERVTKKMTEKLGLSADQAAKIGAINLQHAQEMAALRPTRDADKKTFRQKRLASMKATNDQIKALLSPEQLTTWEAWIAERKAKMKERRAEKGKGGPKGKGKGKGKPEESVPSDK